MRVCVFVCLCALLSGSDGLASGKRICVNFHYLLSSNNQFLHKNYERGNKTKVKLCEQPKKYKIWQRTNESFINYANTQTTQRLTDRLTLFRLTTTRRRKHFLYVVAACGTDVKVASGIKGGSWRAVRSEEDNVRWLKLLFTRCN